MGISARGVPGRFLDAKFKEPVVKVPEGKENEKAVDEKGGAGSSSSPNPNPNPNPAQWSGPSPMLKPPAGAAKLDVG